MNTNPKNKETLALNFNTGGNSPPANLRYNGSPLAAFKMVSPTPLNPGLLLIGALFIPEPANSVRGRSYSISGEMKL